MKALLVIMGIVTLSACSNFTPKDVKPWERGTLARDNMKLVPDEVHTGLDEHIYFSKEAVSGGSGVGGGGCGCN